MDPMDYRWGATPFEELCSRLDRYRARVARVTIFRYPEEGGREMLVKLLDDAGQRIDDWCDRAIQRNDEVLRSLQARWTSVQPDHVDPPVDWHPDNWNFSVRAPR